MMKADAIIARLRSRADELQAQANAIMDSLPKVSEAEETKKNREKRNSAQAAWVAAEELRKLINEFER